MEESTMHLKYECFKDNVKPWFVETGSYNGDGIQAAIDCGFPNIISIEVDPYNYELCQIRFKDNNNVRLVLGDSAVCLFDLIKDIKEPITFWLDAHSVGDKEPLGLVKFPLLYEIYQIYESANNDPTIIIDDLRLFKGPSRDRDFNEAHITCFLYYNEFDLQFVDGTEPKDILIAKWINISNY